MNEHFYLFEVNKKTRFSDVIVLLNKIEKDARNFRLLANRKAYISGCLSACGFLFVENYAKQFPRVCNISADNKIYRLTYSCCFGRFNRQYCFDIDVSYFK